MLLESRERAFDLEAVEQVTAGVDVQDDRLVYVVAGFSAASEQLWILAHGETIGDPRDGEVWRGLAGNLQVPFGRLPVSIVSVDAGFLTSTVKKECQRRRWWIPTVGRAGAGIPIAKRISQTTGIATAGKDDLRVDARIDSIFSATWVRWCSSTCAYFG